MSATPTAGHGPAIDPQTARFLERLTAAPPPDLDTLPIEQFRQGLAAYAAIDYDEVPMAEVVDLPEAPDGRSAMRLYRPASAGERPPLLIWAHGGAWIRGDLDTHDRLLRVIAERSGCALAAVDYRRAPECPYPGGLEDIHACALWLLDHEAEFRFDPSRLAVGGDSSGGNLAAGAALLARDRKDVSYALQALLVPVLDVTFDSASWRAVGDGRYLLTTAAMDWAVERYAPGHDRRAAPLSPVHATSFADLPPAVIAIGGADPCRDDGLEYTSRLRDAGVRVDLLDYPGLIHHAVMAPKEIPLAEQVVDELGKTVGGLLRV